MKIIIDARFYGVEHTGIGRYTMNLVNELTKLDSDNEYWLILRKKYFNTLKLPNNFHKILLDVRHYTIREQFGLARILWKHKPDVFHSLQLNVPYMYFGNQIVTIHDTTQLSANTNATTLPLPLYYMKLLAIQVSFRKALLAIRIIVPTNVVKLDLVHRGAKEKKLSVVHEGFNLSRSTNTSRNQVKKFNLQPNYLLYVGNAYPHKNLNRAIDAVKKLNESRTSPVDFAIVCSRSEFTKDLESYVSRTNTSKFVKLLGSVSDEDLTALYKYSTALLYPSLHEGFGLPGLEAMAAGTVVAASDIPVFNEVFADGAVFFKPTDTNDMTERIRTVLSFSESERRSQIAKGTLNVRKYSWRKMAKETLTLYRTLAS